MEEKSKKVHRKQIKCYSTYNTHTHTHTHTHTRTHTHTHTRTHTHTHYLQRSWSKAWGTWRICTSACNGRRVCAPFDHIPRTGVYPGWNSTSSPFWLPSFFFLTGWYSFPFRSCLSFSAPWGRVCVRHGWVFAMKWGSAGRYSIECVCVREIEREIEKGCRT